MCVALRGEFVQHNNRLTNNTCLFFQETGRRTMVPKHPYMMAAGHPPRAAPGIPTPLQGRASDPVEGVRAVGVLAQSLGAELDPLLLLQAGGRV